MINTKTAKTTATTPRLHAPHTSGQAFGEMPTPIDFSAAAAAARASKLRTGTPALRRAGATTKPGARAAPQPIIGPVTAKFLRDSDLYLGTELAPYQGRPGVAAANQLPSRIGKLLHYRDGRVERMPE